MNSNEIRDRFLKFFTARGHTIIPSASLIPENDPSVLFITAGMQPLGPYLLGQIHPAGTRLVDVQKCVRTTDIDDISDNTHLTFFQMLGNWSLGDYFKEEAIKWSYELLISKEEGFGLDPKRLYVTIFAGDDNSPLDEESKQIWQSIGVPAHRIYALPAENNWWSPGANGPCGPDTEMFYDVTEKGLGDLSLAEFLVADTRREVVEIWNDVFMEYEKKDGLVIGKLTQKNVDTGAGLERLAMVLQKKTNVYETDLFSTLISSIQSQAKVSDQKAERIIVDHLRAGVFMMADGVLPANTDRGYILRRLLRRAIRFADQLVLPADFLVDLIKQIIIQYSDFYIELKTNEEKIITVFTSEKEKFRSALEKGLTEFEKNIKGKKSLSAPEAFALYSSYGLPIDIIIDLAREKNITVDIKGFDLAMKSHQELSKAGSDQKFKGGLGGNSEQIIRYHTATHLLHQALRDVLGPEVVQKGSNITDERLRFDFAYSAKLNDEQKQAVEKIVNEKIQASLSVQQVILPKAEAEQSGAHHLFSEKYGDEVSVYFIGSDLASAYSKEFCGGPHVTNTGELGHFKIIKEEAISAGVRRIKAILE
ncbi:MAG: alanine--tRNA ligase [Candidatus Vogelbacteria bacterium CG22_combo_CG10-13_8_21_14_all_37_9]|uniref:Alanine--tRNA ligase n=1 Tax=Candidatus Vogelbacteria bacterium CG22_combo_CG10-13_8_21_14_all_37_9 TaxID=1975046 RepID=A0A2H0BKT3_9BACT|nr:MAG: alanine--tRNA ligase [Candidatus Vogelbacteria bacterium CG22_combo_CG10-13_8_21_14_all_37_9]